MVSDQDEHLFETLVFQGLSHDERSALLERLCGDDEDAIYDLLDLFLLCGIVRDAMVAVAREQLTELSHRRPPSVPSKRSLGPGSDRRRRRHHDTSRVRRSR